MQHCTSAAGLAATIRAGCLGTRVGQLHRLVDRHFELHLRPLGLSVPQLEVLTALTLMAGPVKPSMLANTLGMERSTVSRNLAVLQSRGWVEPAEISTTGRSMSVRITHEGSARLSAAGDAWTAAQAALVATLGDDAAQCLDTWLTELTVMLD